MATFVNKLAETEEVSYSAKGLVLGITWEGVECLLPLKEFNNLRDNSHIQDWYYLVLQGEHPLHKRLTDTEDFSKELGAIIVTTKTTTIQVNGKPFVNTEVSREFIGDLTAEQMEKLDNEMDW